MLKPRATYVRLVVDNVDLSSITSGLPSKYQSIPTPQSHFNHLPSRSYNLKLIHSLVNIIIKNGTVDHN